MGGVAGHMDHLYDDRDLTFSKMKEIILAASRGEITAEEKVDGQNLFLSYSIKEGKAKAARNLTNIKNGGMDAAQLAEKFAGRGGLLEAFTQGFGAFDRAVTALTDEQKAQIFGTGTDIWYNSEVMSPSNPNIIYYDTKTLKIHDSGHKRRNPETGRPENADVSDSLTILDQSLKKMQKAAAAGGDTKFVRSAVIKLTALENDTAANQSVSNIDNAVSEAGLNDGSTVLEYLKSRILKSEDIAGLDIPNEKKEAILGRLLKLEGAPDLKQIKKGLSEEQLEQIAPATSRVGGQAILKAAIQPIEVAIHKFAVEMLRTIQSLFILNPDKEVRRLRDVLTSTVEEITQMATDGVISEQEMSKMRAELRKISKIEDISSTAEGIVFDYDGHTYKFTGSFAPLNQILGILTYGKKKSQTSVAPGNRVYEDRDNVINSFLWSDISITGLITDEDDGKTVALWPGG